MLKRNDITDLFRHWTPLLYCCWVGIGLLVIVLIVNGAVRVELCAFQQDTHYVQVTQSPHGFSSLNIADITTLANVLSRDSPKGDFEGARLNMVFDMNSNKIIYAFYDRRSHQRLFRSMPLRYLYCKSPQFTCGCGYEILWDNLQTDYDTAMIELSMVLLRFRNFTMSRKFNDVYLDC